VSTGPAALFETHLPVADLDRSVAFYRDVVGLELAYAAPARQVAFMWIGGRGRSMLGLWAGSASPSSMRLHLAFRVEPAAVMAAVEGLARQGVTPLDLWARPTSQPSVIAWMPAVSVFFHDPDGHLLEYLAPLDAAPRPEAGNITWSDWQSLAAP